ncbi:MAG: hypothetical protein HY965_07265, partial [Ignavibacteriales bacterium]|nr:hypothetical protein [Ignavibacteriales bacterium]
MKNKLRVLLPFLIIILFTAPSCKKPGNPVTPPTGNNAKLEIINVDTLCTSVYLKITKVNFTAPASILLSRDSLPVKTFYLWGADTVVFQDSLLPGTNYTYRAQVTDGQIVTDAAIMVRTLDITGNNYSYQTWELGAANRHSLLND